MPFLKVSLKQPDWSSFTIYKARRNIRPHSLASCPAQLEPAWTEAVLQGRAVADGLSVYGSFPTKRCPRARQDCRTREIRGSKESCATHTSHGTAMLHKAGETIGTQHKKPEQLSAAQLGMREEILYLTCSHTHGSKNTYSDIPGIPQIRRL